MLIVLRCTLWRGEFDIFQKQMRTIDPFTHFKHSNTIKPTKQMCRNRLIRIVHRNYIFRRSKYKQPCIFNDLRLCARRIADPLRDTRMASEIYSSSFATGITYVYKAL